MQAISTITQKGQITIPLKLRQMLGLKPYGRVSLKATKNAITLEAAKDIVDLAGMFKPKKGKSIAKARKAMEKSFHRF